MLALCFCGIHYHSETSKGLIGVSVLITGDVVQLKQLVVWRVTHEQATWRSGASRRAAVLPKRRSEANESYLTNNASK